MGRVVGVDLRLEPVSVAARLHMVMVVPSSTPCSGMAPTSAVGSAVSPPGVALAWAGVAVAGAPLGALVGDVLPLQAPISATMINIDVIARCRCMDLANLLILAPEQAPNRARDGARVTPSNECIQSFAREPLFPFARHTRQV